MSDPTSDDFVPPGAELGPMTSPPPSNYWEGLAPTPQESPLERVIAGMRAYIDEQDESHRVAMERRFGELDLYLGDFNQYYEGIFQELIARIAALEARDGSEGYRQYLVAELRRIGKREVGDEGNEV